MSPSGRSVSGRAVRVLRYIEWIEIVAGLVPRELGAAALVAAAQAMVAERVLPARAHEYQIR